MHRLALLALFAAPLSPSVWSQSPVDIRAQAQPVPNGVRNAGVLHLATGTWTRSPQGAANLGPDVLYDNTVQSGYFSTIGTQGATGDFSLIDEGRLPGASSDVVLAESVDFEVDGLTFGYCTDQQGPTIGLTLEFYESYLPCDLVLTNPQAPFTLSGIVAATGLPGGVNGSLECWTVTLDLMNSAEFLMESEGGDQFPAHDGDLNLDSFGMLWTFNGVVGSMTGPLLSGNPDWTPTVGGALLHGGSGTYYDNTGMSCGNTGLDTRDFFALDGDNSGLNNGCYFFGGYVNTAGCGSASAIPFSSFDMKIYGEGMDCFLTCDPTFCNPAGTNSSGNSASLTVTPIATGAGVRLDASGGPQLPNSGFGYFLVSHSGLSSVVIGDGTLCLDSPQGRYAPAAGGALNSLGQFDFNGDFQNLAGTSATGYGFEIPTQLPTPPGGSIIPGSTWFFQLWYRDLNPTSTVSFSNGVTVAF